MLACLIWYKNQRCCKTCARTPLLLISFSSFSNYVYVIAFNNVIKIWLTQNKTICNERRKREANKKCWTIWCDFDCHMWMLAFPVFLDTKTDLVFAFKANKNVRFHWKRNSNKVNNRFLTVIWHTSMQVHNEFNKVSDPFVWE